jgi:hypothetical protein
MAVNVKDVPRLTGLNDYPDWKTGISAAFLILGVSSAINPIPPAPAASSTLPPDPLPFFSLAAAPAICSPPLSKSEAEALALLRAKKKEWDTARQAEEAVQRKAKALQEAEAKKKDDIALGWIFLTIEKTLAQEVLVWMSKKRNLDGSIRKVELREVDARSVWEKIAEKMDSERQRNG